MNTHKMRVEGEVFAAIVAGEKTIESRLNDEKRRLIKVGDNIEFTSRVDGATILVEVAELLHYRNFSELFASRKPAEFGGESQAQLEAQVREFYTPDDESRYGVVGIEFRLV